MNLPFDENEPETLAPQAVSHHHGIALPESSWSILSSLDSAARAPSHPMAPLQHPSSPMSRGNEVIHSCSSPRFHAMSAAPREIIPLDDPALFLAGRRLCSPGNHTPIVAPQPPSKPLAASSRPQRRRRRRPIQRRDTLRFGAPAPRGCGSWPPVRAPTPSTTTGSTGAATGTARAGSDGCGGLERGFGLHWPEGMSRLMSIDGRGRCGLFSGRTEHQRREHARTWRPALLRMQRRRRRPSFLHGLTEARVLIWPGLCTAWYRWPPPAASRSVTVRDAVPERVWTWQSALRGAAVLKCSPPPC